MMKKEKSSKQSAKEEQKKTAEDQTGQINTFYQAFIGEYVEMTGSFTTSEGTPVIYLEGYLLDVDKEYYYLGADPNSIMTAVRKSVVYAVQLKELPDPIRQILEDMEIPEDEGKHN